MAAAVSGQRKLPDELIALSQGNQWPKVLEEWGLDYVDYLDPDDVPEMCFYHRRPMYEVCHITNYVSKNRTAVGNCCVKEFEGETAFKGTHLIIAALKRIRENTEVTANKKLIEYAFEKEFISEEDCEFYLGLGRRDLTRSEMRRKVNLNERIIEQLTRDPQPATAQPVQAIVIRLVPEAFAALRANSTAIADPLLVLHAHRHHAISDKDYEFYRLLFAKNVRNPSPRQQTRINEINGKIFNLKPDKAEKATIDL